MEKSVCIAGYIMPNYRLQIFCHIFYIVFSTLYELYIAFCQIVTQLLRYKQAREVCVCFQINDCVTMKCSSVHCIIPDCKTIVCVFSDKRLCNNRLAATIVASRAEKLRPRHWPVYLDTNCLLGYKLFT